MQEATFLDFSLQLIIFFNFLKSTNNYSWASLNVNLAAEERYSLIAKPKLAAL